MVRNRIEWVDLPDGWAVFTGTWKVIRGTGAYAGLSGGDGWPASQPRRRREGPVRGRSRPALATQTTRGRDEETDSSDEDCSSSWAPSRWRRRCRCRRPRRRRTARRPAARRGADLEHEHGQRGSRLDADEGPDRRHGLHVVRAGGGVRRRDEARGALRAVPRLRVRGRSRAPRCRRRSRRPRGRRSTTTCPTSRRRSMPSTTHTSRR